MSWRDREYGQESAGWRRRELWGILLPPRASLWLIGLHTAAFFILLFLLASTTRPAGGPPAFQNRDSFAQFLQFSGTTAHPLGILLHPFLTRGFLTLLLIVLMAWSLAGRLESRYGAGRMLKLYIVGNLLAGLVYFGLTRWQPQFAGYPLDFPVGALAAWSVAIWRDFTDEIVILFGRVQNTSKITALSGLILAGLVLLIHGPAAFAWLLAAAGGCAAPVLDRLPKLILPQPPRPAPRRKMPRRARPVEFSDPLPEADSEPAPEPASVEIDDILAKISREGMQSLTPAERERLETARQAKLRQSARIER